MLLDFFVNLSRISPMIAASTNIFLGSLVLFYNHKNKRNIIFFLFSLSVAFWALSCFVQGVTSSYETALLWDKLMYTAAGYIPVLFYILTGTFSGKSKRSLIIPGFIISAIFIASNWFGYFRTGLSYNFGMRYVTEAAPAWYAYLGFFGFFFSISCYSMYQTYKSAKEEERKIYYILFIAMFLLLVAGNSYFILILLKVNPILDSFFNLNSSLLLGVYSIIMSVLILKSGIMEVKIVIKELGAWLISLILVALSYFFVIYILQTAIPVMGIITLLTFTLAWALLGHKLKENIITGARHAFVKGYYNQDKMFSDLASKIKNISDKEKIFGILEQVFDKWIKFEKTATIIPSRNADENVTHYLLRYQLLDNEIHNIKIELSDPILEVFSQTQEPTSIRDLEPDTRRLYEKIGFDPKTIFIPFRSIEAVEGILVLGERSGGYNLKQDDLDFFQTVITLVNSILFGLTPLEQIENRYMKNQQKIHDAEVQMLRAEKNQDIGFHHIQMAHEIRSAASIIKMATEDLPDTPEYAENKKAILRANENSTFIASRTLELQEQKASADDLEPVDINDILINSSEIVDPKKHKLVRDFQEIPHTMGNPGELQIAFTNLINNACQAMTDGGSITLKTYVKGPNITIEIADTGPGISDEQKAKIWQPYIAGEQTSGQGNVRHSGGRGWGLTIVNKIISDHSGAIRLESELGVGTTFYIRLPLKDTGGIVPKKFTTASTDTDSAPTPSSAPTEMDAPPGLISEPSPTPTTPASEPTDIDTPPAGLIKDTPVDNDTHDDMEAPPGLIK